VIQGALGGLARWPVKSMAGERLRAARLDGRGVGGDLDAPAFAEERWQGGRLQVGPVTLDLLHPCARCVIPTRDPDGVDSRWPVLLRHLHRARAGLFGVNARVLVPGRVALGDRATVAGPAAVP
jgi:uncharacterized protein YcbX